MASGSVTVRRISVAILGAALLYCAPSTSAAQEAVPGAPPAITVDGSATAALAPDGATLSLGAEATRATAHEAVAADSRVLDHAIATLKGKGVSADAITTTAVDLSPVYDEPKTGTPTVVGYRARNQIEVRLKTSQDIGGLVAEVIDGGVNGIDGLRFTSSAEDATRDRLKGEAAKAARHDAEIYASALGLKLGRVLGIRPGAGAGAGPYRAAVPMAARAASPPLPIEPGRIEVTERVAVTFELVQ